MVNIYVAPVTAALGFSIPFIWLWWKRNSRLKAFAAQLPEAMELVARALRAGHSLAAGLHVVADEMPEPISKEFGRVYEEQNLGISLEEALSHMCARVPNLDLRFFVTSVNIQRQTGGDLAEVLDKSSDVIRDRLKIAGAVKALTAEGRMSGWVLTALPAFVGLLIYRFNPKYMEELISGDAQFLLKLAVFMNITGFLLIQKIIQIKY
jgi:tight adherence protein B